MSILIPQISKFDHVALYVSAEFISTLHELQVGQFIRTSKFMDKILLKFLQCTPIPVFNGNDKICLSIAMGIDSIPGVDVLNKSKFRILYLFDAWPEKYDQIERVVKHLKIKVLFVSSSQAAIQLQKRFSETQVCFCPEACKVEEYEFKPLADRTIDVLQLGRRYDVLHTALMTNRNINYLYQKEAGSLIFPTQDLLKKGFADSKISVCFPKSVTHPVESGGLETVTNRYFQSMASKCVLVGKAPAELITLFGYNPVIELDSKDPLNQVMEILNQIQKYESLVEMNYSTLKKNHTWVNRWMLIHDTIKIIA